MKQKSNGEGLVQKDTELCPTTSQKKKKEKSQEGKEEIIETKIRN